MKLARLHIFQFASMVHAALLLMSVLMILLPAYRSDNMVPIQNLLLTSACAWLVYRAWRRGHLGFSSADLQSHLMKTGRITTGLLERSSLVAGFLAWGVIVFS